MLTPPFPLFVCWMLFLTQVLALAVDTLVWTQLIDACPPQVNPCPAFLPKSRDQKGDTIFFWGGAARVLLSVFLISGLYPLLLQMALSAPPPPLMCASCQSLFSQFSGLASTGSDGTSIPGPCLHGHTAVANPNDPRELLVLGGRGGQVTRLLRKKKKIKENSNQQPAGVFYLKVKSKTSGCLLTSRCF